MLDKIARLLGWSSKREYETLEKHCELLRNHVTSQNAQIDFLKESLKQKEESFNYLQDIVLYYTGMVRENVTQAPQEENLRPINTKPRSIFQTMRAMQRDDALRARTSREEKPGA